MKNETPTTATKQAYETPVLSIFGQVEDLTQGATGTPGTDTGASA